MHCLCLNWTGRCLRYSYNSRTTFQLIQRRADLSTTAELLILKQHIVMASLYKSLTYRFHESRLHTTYVLGYEVRSLRRCYGLTCGLRNGVVAVSSSEKWVASG